MKKNTLLLFGAAIAAIFLLRKKSDNAPVKQLPNPEQNLPIGRIRRKLRTYA